MRTDYDNIQSYSLEKVNSLFESLNIRWGFGGGWSLDLFLGEQTRTHSDIDVVVLQKDLSNVYEKLKDKFIFYKAAAGQLTYWKGEQITPKYSIWVAESDDSPFVFEIVLIESINDEWLYKRNREIKGNMLTLFVIDRYPYLSPEIALLYKMEATQLRDKDIEDYRKVYSKLCINQKLWLDNHCSYKKTTGSSKTY